MTTSESLGDIMSRFRQRIGVEFPVERPHNRVASADAIRHWAYALGDTNPLWSEPEYAASSRYRRVVAPPTFLYSCGGGSPWMRDWSKRHPTIGSTGNGLWTGDSWEWYEPVLEGDTLSATVQLADIIERSSESGTRYEQVTQTTFTNQRGTVAGISRRSFLSMERNTRVGPERKQSGPPPDFEPYRYSESELETIRQGYAAEELRGGEPRYWEDVQEGDAIPTVLKGPLTVTSLICFMSASGSGLLTDKMAWDYFGALPRAGIPDPKTNVPDFIVRVHWDPDFAKHVGFPVGGFDIISQRISWMSHPVTNWMGDNGFLKSLRVQLRRPNRLGDTQWLQGRVAKKHQRDGEHLVDLEQWADNQKGERTTLAWATVRLPSRAG